MASSVIAFSKIWAKVIMIFAFCGLIAMLLMTLLTGTDVVLRYAFKKPLTGTHEITEFLLLVVFAFFLGDCWLQGGHVRMEIVYARIPNLEKYFDFVAAISGIFLFGGLLLIVTKEFLYAFEINQISSAIHLPIWPIKLMIILSLLVSVVQMVLTAIGVKNSIEN